MEPLSNEISISTLPATIMVSEIRNLLYMMFTYVYKTPKPQKCVMSTGEITLFPNSVFSIHFHVCIYIFSNMCLVKKICIYRAYLRDEEDFELRSLLLWAVLSSAELCRSAVLTHSPTWILRSEFHLVRHCGCKCVNNHHVKVINAWFGKTWLFILDGLGDLEHSGTNLLLLDLLGFCSF